MGGRKKAQEVFEMRRTVVVALILLVAGALGLTWLAVASGDYVEDRQVGYLNGIRCEAVGRVYAPVWNGKYWEMRGEATSDASQVIDQISVESTLEVNGSASASDEDKREDDDHAETTVVQTWTNPWYEVCYKSRHLFRHRFTNGWQEKLLNTRPCYASKEGQP